MKLIFGSDQKNRRSSLSYIPTPPNSRMLGRSSALAARTRKIDSHHRALLKLNFSLRGLSGFNHVHRKYFIYKPTLKKMSRITTKELCNRPPYNRRRLPQAYKRIFKLLYRQHPSLWDVFFCSSEGFSCSPPYAPNKGNCLARMVP
jgi:hypothetical protein